MRVSLPSGMQIRVEVCRRHGVWFDDQDLLLVARAVAAALGKPVPQAVASLDGVGVTRTTVDAQSPSTAASATENAPSRPAWTPTPTTDARSRTPSVVVARKDGVLEHAGHTALGVVDVGVEAAFTVVDIVALPVELSLAIVEGLGSIFD